MTDLVATRQDALNLLSFAASDHRPNTETTQPGVQNSWRSFDPGGRVVDSARKFAYRVNATVSAPSAHTPTLDDRCRSYVIHEWAGLCQGAVMGLGWLVWTR